MSATTVKLEDELLEEIEAAKPKALTTTAFVRELLRQELLRRRLRKAAHDYRHFLETSSEESAFIEDWESADLEKPLGKSGQTQSGSNQGD